MWMASRVGGKDHPISDVASKISFNRLGGRLDHDSSNGQRRRAWLIAIVRRRLLPKISPRSKIGRRLRIKLLKSLAFLGDSPVFAVRGQTNQLVIFLKHSRVATGRPFRSFSAHRDNRPKPSSS